MAALTRVAARPPAYANVIVRSRYNEDALHRAVARGTRQYLLIGAGFDSYALRIPPEAFSLAIVEVDHSASQAFRYPCIATAGLSEPEALHFIAADPASQVPAAVLRASSLQAGEPAFFWVMPVMLACVAVWQKNSRHEPW